MLGRWAAQKDPDYFRARVQELRAALAEPVEARWIGSADGGAAAAGHDEPRVHVTGWLPATEVAVQLRELDLYLHTAAWEGFPIALLDAHAVGAPILGWVGEVLGARWTLIGGGGLSVLGVLLCVALLARREHLHVVPSLHAPHLSVERRAA